VRYLTGDSELSRRFGLALEYHQHVENLKGAEPDAWLHRLDSVAARPSIALSMALIHGDVVPLNRSRWLEHRGDRIFKPRPRNGRTCWSIQVWGYECPCKSSELELDHAWPFALGGRSVPENAIWLCSIHNRAKSSDVHCYHWKDGAVPSWVELLTQRFRFDVLSGRYKP